MNLKLAPLNIPLSRRLQTLSAAFWIVSLGFGGLICWFFTIYILLFSSYWYFGLMYIAWVVYDKDTPFNGGRKYVELYQSSKNNYRTNTFSIEKKSKKIGLPGRKIKNGVLEEPSPPLVLPGLRWCYFRYLPFWKYFIDYFPIQLVKTTEIPPDRNYLFCVYPHGVLPTGIFGNFASAYSESKKLFPGLRFYGATLDFNFKAPLFREYILALGCVSSSQASLINILSSKEKGIACSLVIGGAAESFYAKPGPYRIILNKRKGFVKVALRAGCSIVPVFSFGEIDVYDQVIAQPGTKFHKFQNWFKKKTGMAFIVPKGRGLFQYSFGILPQRAPINTIVGAPIDLPKILNPTEEDINHYHELFKTKLIELFNEHKGNYVANPEKAFLEIE